MITVWQRNSSVFLIISYAVCTYNDQSKINVKKINMLLIQSHRDTCNYYCWQQLFYVHMYLYICGVRWCGDSDRWWEHQWWGCLVTIVQCYGGHLRVHHRRVYLVRGYVYGDHRRCAVDVVLSLQDLNQTFYHDMLNNNNIYQLLVPDGLKLQGMTITLIV